MDEVNSFIVILVLACGVLSLLLLSLLVVYRMCIFVCFFFLTCEDRGFGPHLHPQTLEPRERRDQECLPMAIL